MGSYGEAIEAGHPEGAEVILMDYDRTNFYRQSEMQRK
jgi:hypothetical protein